MAAVVLLSTVATRSDDAKKRSSDSRLQAFPGQTAVGSEGIEAKVHPRADGRALSRSLPRAPPPNLGGRKRSAVHIVRSNDHRIDVRAVAPPSGTQGERMDALKKKVGAMCAVVAFGVLVVIGLGLGVVDWFESSWSFRSKTRQRLRNPRPRPL